MDKIDLQYFLDKFPFKINASQKANLIRLVHKYDESTLFTRLSHYACSLGNMAIETNWTFAPVVEGYYIKPDSKRVRALYSYYKKHNPGALKSIFPNGPDGVSFYGRGDIQLTHDFNYKKFAPLVKAKFPHIDLMKNPEMACDFDVAFLIMEEGMTNPTRTFRDANFTGHTLEMYFTDTAFKWVSSRQIINGLDRANEIASYSQAIYKALRFKNEIEETTPEIVETADPVKVEAERAEAKNGEDILNGIADNI